ncbi:Imm1 family immunity protein [Actinokineospora enzanensis]|uniref:Imm1 family immunity protein n=1 Tax=Actinokineospora enzanensis TaxID=155975 RepID=UPI00035DFE5B|nr:Imm1 family immunity protein [Actinokineospora enzanensis]
MLWYVQGEPDTPEFGVGVNDDRGSLSYSGRNAPGLWFTLGNSGSVDDLLGYDYMSNEQPTPANSEIPFEDVVRAATEFLVSGSRPASVEWQKLA